MIPTRRAAFAQSGHRFPDATNAKRVCAEIMRKTSRMIPKSGYRFSGATNAKRVCAEIMRKTKAA
jgi:hypothetical protein